MKINLRFVALVFFLTSLAPPALPAEGDYLLTDGFRWIVIWSKPSVSKAQSVAKVYHSVNPDIPLRIFHSKNGQFAIVLGPFKLDAVSDYDYSALPSDAYLAEGKNFDSEIAIADADIEVAEQNNLENANNSEAPDVGADPSLEAKLRDIREILDDKVDSAYWKTPGFKFECNGAVSYDSPEKGWISVNVNCENPKGTGSHETAFEFKWLEVEVRGSPKKVSVACIDDSKCITVTKRDLRYSDAKLTENKFVDNLSLLRWGESD